jgi:NADPH-dependent 2,4-dienoyl-CoA reductase/sulfur reductase-like enzyme/rhodanese-related sulfurtransferase
MKKDGGSTMKKVLIVGGVAAGASAAARLRRLDENAEIIMFEKGDYISFANCGLPYYIGDVIKEREKLLVATPKLMKDRFKIDVRVNSEIIGIDTNAKKVMIQSEEKGLYEEAYDVLVLAPGAKPLVPNIPGINSEKIFTLRNVKDTDHIKAQTTHIQSAIVIGGGYIGIEMAENLKEKNIDVTLIEAAPHILAPFDEDLVVVAEKEMQDKGIQIVLNDGVKGFRDLEKGIEVELQSGACFKADIIISAMGVAPDTAFLHNTEINLGVRGHILVNDTMETNIKDIYAGGDAVEIVDFVNGKGAAIPLAGPANKHGRIIADNISGLSTRYKKTQGTSVIKVFDLTLAATGNNERTLNRLEIPYKVLIVHPNNHAGYYPGASQISLKLIFNEEGKILGAQALGYEGVEKRIDVIATVLRLGGTVYDLTELELSYAPPFGSAKDPVNFAGYVAENVLTGKSDIVHPRELESIKNHKDIVILDVRTAPEREKGKVEGSVHINVNELRAHLDKLDRSKEYWIHCAVGVRAYVAERILKQAGFKCKNITGGYKTIEAMGFKPQIKE